MDSSANTHTQKPEDDVTFSALKAALTRYLSHHAAQAQCVSELAKTEAQLSLRAVVTIIALIVVMAVSATFIWFSALAAIGYGIFSLWHSLLLSVTVVIALQILFIWWLAMQLVDAIAHIGFSKTLHVLTSKHSKEKDDAE
ncbi:hypothetical protein AAEU32_07370 [Pseudoalteromonas sp. SSDWG2]|uniref:hypothetical protein n=1 Tax=Pseudoalteromonas sp. SSDWG2 TaxID=3139391 RepID=UPI003BAD87BF